MEAILTAAEADAFRHKCREFLDSAIPEGASGLEAGRQFLQAAADAGLGGIIYPTEYGGAGLTVEHDRIWRAEKAKHPPIDSDFVISHGMCLPVMNDFGTEEQKYTYMPDIISGRTMWCQMFSEPGAGSDAASLQMRAELDGDEWTLNGQKVWTTLAHRSDYGILIARNDPSVPKHAGISMFMVDMKSPGIEIRPIHQIDGGRHFNEVFFTDVRIPAANLVGEINSGWNQATAMLMYERVAIGDMGSQGIQQPSFDSLVAEARRNGRIADPTVRDELMKLYAMETTKSLVAMRNRAEVRAGKAPGPGGSLGKLAGSEIMWAYRALALNIVGTESIAWEPDSDGGRHSTNVVSSFQAGIAGGTDEIQRNIIGDRVLGLPREPSADRGIPFRDLKVGTQT